MNSLNSETDDPLESERFTVFSPVKSEEIPKKSTCKSIWSKITDILINSDAKQKAILFSSVKN